MDINLEKIELVKDRTGSTYAEAKEALEKADGSVVDAIIDIEDKMNKKYQSADGQSLKDSALFTKMKAIVDKGNVSRVVIRKGEKVFVDFPLTAGVIGAVLVPWGAILGAVAAVGTQCEIEFVNDKGEILDINGKVVGVVDKFEDFAYRTSDKIQELGGKGSDAVEKAWDKLGESETLDDVKEKFEKGASRLIAEWNKLEASGKIDEVKGSVEKIANKVMDSAKQFAQNAADRAKADEESFKADAEEAAEEEFTSDDAEL